MNLKAYCASFVRKAVTNFYWAFVFLPKAKREAIFAAYAFSRHTDDIVDDAPSREAAIKNINQWRDQLNACYMGTATHPLAQNLQRILPQFPIPIEHFLLLIEGVEMDLEKNRYDTFDDLYAYCYRVASVVGLICIEIFGYTNPQTRDFAIQLGIALQLTNILRDIKKDGQINRIYLPQEDLNRFGYTEQDLFSETYNQAFVDLMTFQCQRAHTYYQKAKDLLPPEDRKALFSAEIMGRIYFELLRKIERAQYNVYTVPIRLSNSKKIGTALSYWLASRFRRGPHK